MRFTMDTVRQPGHPPVRSAAGLEGGRFQLVLSIPLLWHWLWHWHDEVDHNHHMRARPCTSYPAPCTMDHAQKVGRSSVDGAEEPHLGTDM